MKHRQRDGCLVARAFPARPWSHGEHFSCCWILMIIIHILCRLGKITCFVYRYRTESSRNRLLVVSIFLACWWWKENHHRHHHHESQREAAHCWCWWDVFALLHIYIYIFFCSKKKNGGSFCLLASAKNGGERTDLESPIHKAPPLAFMQGDIINSLNGKERRRSFRKWKLSKRNIWLSEFFYSQQCFTFVFGFCLFISGLPILETKLSSSGWCRLRSHIDLFTWKVSIHFHWKIII